MVFKGSVVQLKSGGPDMTVRWVDDKGVAFCNWFDGADAKGELFTVSQLVLKSED